MPHDDDDADARHHCIHDVAGPASTRTRGRKQQQRYEAELEHRLLRINCNSHLDGRLRADCKSALESRCRRVDLSAQSQLADDKGGAAEVKVFSGALINDKSASSTAFHCNGLTDSAVDYFRVKRVVIVPATVTNSAENSGVSGEQTSQL